MPAPTPRTDHPVLRRTVRVGLPVAAVLALAVLAAASLADRRGRNFLACGRRAVAALDRTAAALTARDPRALERTFDPAFSGRDPGLSDLSDREPTEQRDGVEIVRARPASEDASPLDRPGAVAAWMRYLEGFDAIESVELHVLRVERWTAPGDPDGVTAIARFELIGTPAGAPRAGVDRARLRVRFAPGRSAPSAPADSTARGGGDENGRFRIVGLEPLPSDPPTRVIARRARFVDVAQAAGVAFENRYYPGFLDRPLAFPMIRYGPAGITAADYDGDGFDDLFIPDGVASRLFRNRGDGTFEDVTEAAGLAGLSGVSVAPVRRLRRRRREGPLRQPHLRAQPALPRRGRRHLHRRHRREPASAPTAAPPSPPGPTSTTTATWTSTSAATSIPANASRPPSTPGTASPTASTATTATGHLHRRHRAGRRRRHRASAWARRSATTTTTAGPTSGWPTTSAARPSTTTGGTAPSRTSPSASGTLAYGAGMSSSFGDYDNDGRLDLYVAHIRSEHAWYAEAPTVRRYMVNSFRQGVWRSDMPLYWQIFRQSGTHFVEVFQQMASGNTLLRNRRRRRPSRTRPGRPGPTRRAGSGAPASPTSTTTAGSTSTPPNGWVYGERGHARSSWTS